MTSGQETERVYSYNPGARMGLLQVGCPSCRPTNGDNALKEKTNNTFKR